MNKVDQTGAIDIACKYLTSIGMTKLVSERRIRVEKRKSTFNVFFLPQKKARSGIIRITIDTNGIILSTQYER